MFKNLVKITAVVGLFVLLLSSCSGNKIKPTASAEERLAFAMKKFNDENYLDAKTEFKILILNFPGHTLSAQAQYMYAECHFKLKEYILSAGEYEKLKRVFPNSEYVDDAQFKIGLSYFELSPKFSLDQDYTTKAIEEFQKFLEDYPQSELVSEANRYMKKCRDKMATKYFKNAESYHKLHYYSSAIIYYDYVLDNYYDTEYSQRSLVGKAECYHKKGDIEEAIKFYKLYLEKYPKGSKIGKVKAELEKIANRQG